jgi:hypothetical protein
VTIRSMMSGESTPCYKVAATIDGKTVEGYLDAGVIGGVEEFERARRDAEHLALGQVREAFHLSSVAAAGGGGAAGAQAARSPEAALAVQAMSLVDASQPQKALELLEPRLKKTRDPDVLAVAGAAAWRADDTARALEYWRASLALQPNPQLEALYARLQSEAKNDRGSAKLVGMRVQLRYDSDTINADAARGILGTLDQEYGRITAELGCPGQERVLAVAQTREAYLKATQAAEWSGGQFDGRIHVPVSGAAGAGDELHRTLAHEMVHACLTMMGQWPLWLQEGIAQKLSGDELTAQARQKIGEAMRANKIPALTALGQDWSRLDAESAHTAYAESLAAIDVFYENYSGLGLRNLLRSPERVPQIAVDLDRLLRQ